MPAASHSACPAVLETLLKSFQAATPGRARRASITSTSEAGSRPSPLRLAINPGTGWTAGGWDCGNGGVTPGTSPGTFDVATPDAVPSGSLASRRVAHAGRQRGVEPVGRANALELELIVRQVKTSPRPVQHARVEKAIEAAQIDQIGFAETKRRCHNASATDAPRGNQLASAGHELGRRTANQLDPGPRFHRRQGRFFAVRLRNRPMIIQSGDRLGAEFRRLAARGRQIGFQKAAAQGIERLRSADDQGATPMDPVDQRLLLVGVRAVGRTSSQITTAALVQQSGCDGSASGWLGRRNNVR